jgi:hypothetical protein
MPAIRGSIDPNQEDTFQQVLAIAIFKMQTWEVTLHELTSCGLAKLLRWQRRAARSFVARSVR